MATFVFRLPRLCSSTPRQLRNRHQSNITHISTNPVSRFAQQQFHSQSRVMSEQASAYRANGDNGDDGSTEGELNAWKHRAPYRVHDTDPDFKVRYEGSCHCGKIKYQLSREKPLDSKYCHCHTCQKLHGMSNQLNVHLSQMLGIRYSLCILIRHCYHSGSVPMGRNFPQRRYQLHTRPP